MPRRINGQADEFGMRLATLLPTIARVLGVSVEALHGTEAAERRATQGDNTRSTP